MTQTSFAALCESYGIHPAIALEDARIRKALAARDDKEVERILREGF